NINELTFVTEMLLTIGVFMLTIGTFLGGVWANESWGRYWGWDPKETWALVAVIGYAVVLHFRYIPALKGKFLFNSASLWGFSLILFTFFGVNFMLVGLHSYAQGDGLGHFPVWLSYTIVGFILFNIISNDRRKDYPKGVQTKEWWVIGGIILLVWTIFPGFLNWYIEKKMNEWNADEIAFSTWWLIFNWIVMVIWLTGALSLIYFVGKKVIVGNKRVKDGEI
ncbi:MAG: cytochrome c biogenesis protein CcsA, partial [Crocinitomicaceae bacterium]|nr:cytochrome c biogenesis protein CcsA [Crocinitomicaceae bacterium]